MVRIQVKHGGDSDENREVFLYECQSTSTIGDIAKDVTEMANLQWEIRRICLQLQPRLAPVLQTHPEVISLMRALSEANSYTSKDQVLHNRPLSNYVLKDHMRSIEREFTVNYQILGFSDPNLHQILEDLELLQDNTAHLLWAGKLLVRSKKLCDYIGKNEKTKIIITLQLPGSGSASNSLD